MLAEIRANFVAVADSDVIYRESHETDNLERQLLTAAFEETGHPIQQGVWIVTASGRFLAGSTGWHELTGPQFLRAAMRRSLEAYRRLPRAERLLRRRLDPARDRMPRVSDNFERPEGVLDLRVVTRCLPFEGMELTDTRHPDYYKLDRLWFRHEEARRFVPSLLEKGARERVTGPAFDRLATLHLGTFVQPNPPWRMEDLKEGGIESEVESVKGDRVTVPFSGGVDFAGSSQQNRRLYQGELLGHAVYDRRREAFVEFEMLCFGTHTLPDDDRHGNSGSQTAELGVLVTLNPGGEPDDQLLPTYWQWGYPRDWRATE